MPAVPLGSPLKKRSIIKRLINFKYHTKLGIAKFMSEYQVKKKLKRLLSYTFDVLVTGLILWYIFHGTYKFISYGLASVVGLYYLQKVVEIIKQKGGKE